MAATLLNPFQSFIVVEDPIEVNVWFQKMNHTCKLTYKTALFGYQIPIIAHSKMNVIPHVFDN